MTKRSLYACFAILIALPRPAAPAGPQRDAPPACAVCLAVVLTAGQGVLLPDQLYGMTILLQAPWDKTPEPGPAIEAIRSRGGVPGVTVTVPVARDEASRIFTLRTRLTELRSRLPLDTILVLDETSDPLSAGGRREVAGYVDGILTRDREAAAAGGRRWLALDAASAEEALAATRGGAGGQWAVRAPADALDARRMLHELAIAAAPPPDAFTEDVTVIGTARLTVEEIVARHQAFVRRQAAHVRQTISTGVLTLTFEAPGFAAPVTITSDTVIYDGGGRTEIEQREIRVNGIAFAGRGVPRLPILEPERVATPPLTITLSDRYRYRLDGEDTIAGIRCYVVSFEPLDDQLSLFSGRAWIATDTFAAVRIAGAQTRLRGAIVSSEQVDDFRPVAPGVWLLARSDVRQIYEGAAHRTPIQRLLSITNHEVNPGNFEARLAAAYASPSVMLRDTAEGYRYLERRPSREGTPGEAVPLIVEVAGRAQRVRTLAAGVIVDPNISIPLPFAGLSYVDFNLFGTGAQLNAFFGGSYGQLALSVPSLGGSRWQLAGRAFGIASSYNDRSFREGREVYEENIRQRPAHASVWLLRPLTPRLSFRVGYDLDYTRLRGSESTAADFIVPADQIVHGFRVALEGQRDGWSGSLWWNPARRSGWRAWGRTAQDFDPSHGGFQRFGATIARASALTPAVVARVEAAVMAGRDLDRFSRYSFGTFDNRLRGYPSALVRYDRGGVARAALAWSATRFVRIDGFVDSAIVRDRGYGTGYRNYTGVGAAVEGPLPFGMLASVEWGYGFRGVRADGGLGTQVVRVTAFKVF